MTVSERLQFLATSEQMLEKSGVCLALLLKHHLLVTLSGELGAGKTTLVRGLLRGAGYAGPVKSPTFSLVEPYETGPGRLFHFDLYRLKDPQELEFIGMRDYLSMPALCIVEWPEKAGDFLPIGDIHIMIERTGQGRKLELQAQTERARDLMLDHSIQDCWSKLQSEAQA